MREFFKENVKWQLSNGEGVEVLSQPWYEGWQVAQQAARRDRKIKVTEVFDFGADQWKREELTRLLGEDITAHIVQTVQKPYRMQGLSDKLNWNYNKSGRYTVKDGYNCSIMRMGRQESEVTWKCIWTWKRIAPKVRVFMWRLLMDGLPLANNLHRRIHTISPMCTRCNQENEFATHCFFFCHGSRMVWFGGELGLRTDELPLDIKEAVQYITQGMNEDQICTFCYTLWEIWLARNDWHFQRKNFDPREVCAKVRPWKGGARKGGAEVENIPPEIDFPPYELNPGGWQMIVDASWDAVHKAGIAYMMYCEERLHMMGMENQQADDPFEAEALALQAAVLYLNSSFGDQRSKVIQIFSDCLNLVKTIEELDLENLSSWRVRPILANIIREIATSAHYISVKHVRREAVKSAHELANHARRLGSSYHGGPSAMLMMQHNIGMMIDERFYQQVQEAPP
ncbi:Ribonuclease H-like superfamily protein [Rhynchospora pubera]|uniref:Ribonuclease H-like superfamily protein n=1 Tax=Rhynchospora pubera TaxID=906938 RepID=A0AAV8GBH8_9POAL|nr:Ribonuclease H-like superfamily protein [Rhynchospora pubera]